MIMLSKTINSLKGIRCSFIPYKKRIKKKFVPANSWQEQQKMKLKGKKKTHLESRTKRKVEN
jgi:hypothetical protein